MRSNQLSYPAKSVLFSNAAAKVVLFSESCKKKEEKFQKLSKLFHYLCAKFI